MYIVFTLLCGRPKILCVATLTAVVVTNYNMYVCTYEHMYVCISIVGGHIHVRVYIRLSYFSNVQTDSGLVN